MTEWPESEREPGADGGAGDIQPESDQLDADGGALSSESRAFLEAVRRVAGFRVSPREAAAAAEAVTAAGETPSPERVAGVVAAGRGERSQRQRRHADLWRALGAQLAVRGQPADPDAQRAFVGAARAAARRDVNDALVLRVAVEVAAAEAPLTPRLVGAVTRRVVSRGGRRLDEDDLAEVTREAIPAVLEALAQAEPDEEEPEVVQEPARPQRGWWRPRPVSPPRPQVRRKRRAKPAGRARKRKGQG